MDAKIIVFYKTFFRALAYTILQVIFGYDNEDELPMVFPFKKLF